MADSTEARPRGAPLITTHPPIDTTAALAAVRRLSFASLEGADVEAVHAALAHELFGVFGVDEVHITELAPDRESGEGVQYVRTDAGVASGARYTHPVAERSAALTVARTGEPVAEPDALGSAVMDQGRTRRFGMASGLFVPVAFDGGPQRVAGLLTRTRREYAPEEIELARTLANQCSASLAVLAMRDRLQQRADRQTALARAASALNARLDLRAVLDTLCREADEALGGDVAGVYLGEGHSGGLAVAAHGMPADSEWFGYVIQPGEGVAGQVLVTGEPAFSNSYATDVVRPASEALSDVQTAVAVPMRWNGELKGALSVGFHSMRALDERDMESLQAVADLASVACSNAEALERAEIAARTDSLTSLLNHGAVHVRLRDEIARLGRGGGGALSCLLLDLDAFKPVNDVHGHLVGDQLLQRVARALEEEFRTYDGIGRFGGDEFVLVLPGMDTEQAEDAARRAAEVVSLAVARNEVSAGITASIGVAQWRELQTAAELLDRADRALLLAKRRGSGQVVVASAETETELARREWNESGPTELLAAVWDMVSQCERPADVARRLPAVLRDALELEDCVLVHPDLLPASHELLGRLDGGAVGRSTLPGLLEALGAGALPLPARPGSHAALALGSAADFHGLLVMRHAAEAFPLSLMRLAEIAAAQAVTAVSGQASGASRSAVGALAAAIDARDNYTHTHSEEVVALATEVARSLRLAAPDIERVRDGAMLHDVGKVAIPNEILYKDGPLDEAEWEVMREHPVIGEQILMRTPELQPIAKIVRHEHERWDGGGYPDGLAGEEIPIGSRIVLACDAYNAMITQRPYRRPMTDEAARAELAMCAGTQFDPDVVGALLAVLAAQATKPV